MSFIEFDSLRAAHLLARIQSEAGMRADALFERTVEDSVTSQSPRRRYRQEQGFAIRLLTKDRVWHESRDGIEGIEFDQALRRAARSLSSVPLPKLAIRTAPWPDPTSTLPSIPAAVENAVRERRAGFPFSLDLSFHRRELVLAGPTILAEPQEERYLSFRARLGDFDGGQGIDHPNIGGLFPLSPSNEDLGPNEPTDDISAGERAAIVNTISTLLVERFRTRKAKAPNCGQQDVVLSPNATAVFLHEAVAHALESDTLCASGSLTNALGLQLASPLLDVVDDPLAAPVGVRRTHDDEGAPTSRRWLLREGKVCQPLADISWSERLALDPGNGRRASRHELAGPRSYFLELLAGQASTADLLSGEGLWFDQITAGTLQPLTGQVHLRVACGRRFQRGALGEPVGSFVVTGTVADLLGSATAVGSDSANCGAGWCAKNGQRMPVWARAPSIRLENVEVSC